MKKRILHILFFMVLVLMLSGCGKNENAKEIALISNSNNLEEDDSSRFIWESIQSFAEEQKKTYEMYVLEAENEEAGQKAMEKAIEAGAKVVICKGELFEIPVYNLQKEHKKVKFVLINGVPHDDERTDSTLNNNTCAIFFADEQAGFLAGYAAVKDGNRRIGFMGGEKDRQTIAYGTGFLQGAQYAANELGLVACEVSVKYTYLLANGFSPATVNQAKNWYNAGTEVIFTSDELIDSAVIMAAESIEGKKVIAAQVDQSVKSERILTSAIQEMASAVTEILTRAYDDDFPEGSILEMDASAKKIGLTIDTSRFQSFDQTSYDAIFGLLQNSDVTVSKEEITSENAASAIPLIRLEVQ